MSDKRIMDLTEQVNSQRGNLAENRWNDYCENLTGWDRGVVAQLLENEASHLASLTEETRTSSIGSFEKFIFPMIRAVWPNLVSQELVSVQPMEGPISMLFFLDFTAGSAKGNVKKGDTLISSRRGNNENAFEYQSEFVKDEPVTKFAAGSPTARTQTLAYRPVRPGSLVLSATYNSASFTATDDGAGNLVGLPTAGSFGSGQINYTTGVITLNVGTSSDVDPVTAQYEYNSEMSDLVPQLDASLTSAPVISRADKLRARWSVEVAAQLKAVHGLDAEVELTEALAQQIRFGIDNKLINNLFGIAAAGNVSFDVNPPAGSNIPYFTHQMSLVKTMAQGSNQIFKETRRGYGNWIVCGTDAATIIESHPLFETAGNLNGPGVVFSGVLANRWKVFKNPYLPDATKFLIGYKGMNFFDAGFVYAPWIPFYQTQTITLDDMMFRKGVMTHYGQKAINGLFYCNGTMVNA
jgi:hypothetical protein